METINSQTQSAIVARLIYACDLIDSDAEIDNKVAWWLIRSVTNMFELPTETNLQCAEVQALEFEQLEMRQKDSIQHSFSQN